MSTITTEIRRADPEDAQGIADVHDAAWQNTYAGMVPHMALLKMIKRRGSSWWRNAIVKATVILVVEIDGEIAGYATLGNNRVSTLPFDGEIYEIYMRPEYQGLGLGSRLFLAARSELVRRGLSGATVWVLAENDSAISFYENAGGRAVAKGSETFDGKALVKIAYAWD
ncbi:MAG: GNAT family N-acetyltransferase [Rhizobiaceae bacterium]|nr:GNAT family N-acetyltransferase [Rhizobiaceae bacterium]MBL4695623.1 GNAT family N-acetyltransferase [Rhizobiaceae bacterium]